MMNLDGHIHIGAGDPNPIDLKERMAAAGMAGGLLLSQAPASFDGTIETAAPVARLENLMTWCADEEHLYPFYWIDPVETDALRQVDLALSQGVMGFKVICDHFYPGDTAALQTYRAIAEAGKPILFHSGILWDGKASSQYSRPANFEALLGVNGLRFALAHISWPWVDECIAVYGKLASARRSNPDASVEMFIDTTPGTPPIYRREALTKVFTVGYDVARNVFFGSDTMANEYGSSYARDWMDRDRSILAEIGVEASTQDGVFGDNLRRFVGWDV
jgi:predicted TIM-barrel fold metal-dependent hydrolase